jgi:phage-related protein
MATIASLLVKLGLDSTDFDKGADRSERKARGLGGAIDSALSVASGMGIFQAGMGIISGAVDMAKGAVIGMNAELETTQLQFTTLMRREGETIEQTADRAKEHVAGLFEFAKTTPFETGPIIEASRMLRTFGGDALDTKDNLTLIGDASAAVGAPINELGFWTGRLYANLQAGQPFGEAAARLQELAVMSPEARLEMEKLQAAGAKGPEVFAVYQKSLEKFEGAMVRQAGTWEGMTSTFSDTVQMLSATAFKPLFTVAGQALNALNTFLGQEGVGTAITNFSQTLAEGLSSGVAAITSFVQSGAALFQAFASGFASDSAGLGDALTNVVNKVMELFPGLAPILEPFRNTITGIGDAIQGFYDIIIGGQEPLGSWGEWFDFLSETLGGPAATAITNFAMQLSGLLEVGRIAFAHLFDAVGGFSGVMRTAQGIVGAVIENWIGNFTQVLGIIADVMPSILSIIRSVLGIVIGFIKENGASIRDTFATVWNGAREVISTVLSVIGTVVRTVLGAVAGFLKEHGADIRAALSTAWQSISEIIKTVVAIIQATVIPVLRGIGAFIAAHGEEIQGLLSGAWTIIKNVVLGALDIIKGVLKAALAIIKGDWKGAWEAIRTMFASVWDRIKGVFSGAIEFLKNALSIAVDGMRATAGRIGEGIIGGIKGAIDSGKQMVIDALISVVTGAIDWAKKILGIHSPSKVAAEVIGNPISQGMAKGVLDGKRDVVKAVDETLIDAINSATDAITKGAGALGLLNDFVVPAREKVAAFAIAVRDIVADFWHAAREVAYTLKGDIVPKFAEAATKSVELISAALNAFKDLNSVALVPDEVLDIVVENIANVLVKITELAREFKDQGIPGAVGFADAASTIVTTFVNAMGAFTDIADVRLIPDQVLDIVAENIANVVLKLVEIANEFKDQGVDAAALFAEHTSKIVDLVVKAFEAFSSMDKAKNVASEVLSSLGVNIELAVEMILNIARRADVEGTAAAAAFATSVGAIIELIAQAYEAFNAIDDYTKVASERLTLLGADIELAARLMTEIAGRANTEGVKSASAFATALKAVFELFKIGVEALDLVRNYQAIPKDRMGGVLLDFEQATNLMAAIAARANIDGIKIASDFAGYAKLIFEALKTAIEVLDSIREYQKVPRERFASFYEDFEFAIFVMDVINQRAGVLLGKAQEYARVAKEIRNAIETGNGSIEAMEGVDLSGSAGLPNLPVPEHIDQRNPNSQNYKGPTYNGLGSSSYASAFENDTPEGGNRPAKYYHIEVNQTRLDTEKSLMDIIRELEMHD